MFDGHPTVLPLTGQVVAVWRYRLDELTAEQAHEPPGTDMALFAAQLRENYYPDMPGDAMVDVAEITIVPVSR